MDKFFVFVGGGEAAAHKYKKNYENKFINLDVNSKISILKINTVKNDNIKNGPKGTSEPMEYFFNNHIKIKAYIAPYQKDKTPKE